MKTISKTEFMRRAKDGIYLNGAGMMTLDSIIKCLSDKAGGDYKSAPNIRKLENNSASNLRMSTSDGTFSYLQIAGDDVKIYEYNDFLIVVSGWGDGKTNVVIYS
jgi:hypothetical protein